MRKLIQVSAVALAVLALSSCNNSGNNNSEGKKIDRTHVKSERAGLNEVVVHINGDMDKLNPLTYTSADAGYAIGRLFMQLEDVDPDSFNLFPQLVVARPEMKLIDEGEYKGGLSLTFEIRPEATWDNGTPVTADDVAFSVKALKNPQVDAEPQRPYMEFLDDIVIDKTNPRKFTYLCKGRYMLSEVSAGLFAIMPEYVYDPDKIMRKFSVKDLNNPKAIAKLKSNPDIIRFAKQFNSEKYAREKGIVNGCGPYELDQWITGQRIILKKKKNWWGDKLKNVNRDFVANPDKITYEVIVDVNAATSALKGEKIDVLTGLKAKDYMELSKDERMMEKYNFGKPDQLSYSYIGLNMRNAKLNDVKIRRALAHCLDVDKIIEKISYGMAKRVVGPISPRKPYYNKDLQPIPFDIAKAGQLLDEAGWKDSDGDGIRDKVINGQKTKLSLEVKYPSGSDVVEKIITLFGENCKKAGIEITQAQREWTVFLQETKQHNFEISYGAWIAAPVPEDPKQIWSTSSYEGGSNYVGFGDANSDALIEKIRYELDETKRGELYKEFQKVVYDQQPYIFMSSPLNRMAIHARFTNAEPKVARPGYAETEFVLDPTFGSKASETKPQ
jgi:peptide/nickel transport system substrate-binding protein